MDLTLLDALDELLADELLELEERELTELSLQETSRDLQQNEISKMECYFFPTIYLHTFEKTEMDFVIFALFQFCHYPI